MPDPQRNIDSILDYLLSPSTPGAHSPAPTVGSFYDRFRQRGLYLKLLTLGGVALLTLSVLVYALWWKAPPKFPAGLSIAVKEGTTLTEVSHVLEDLNVIRSEFWFKAWSIVLGGNRGLKAGEYYFAAPISVFELAKRFTRGIQNIVPVRVTIPEGLSNKEVAKLLSRSLPRLNQKRFLELAKAKEGYLFPDTYIFQPSMTEEAIIKVMEENFAKRIQPLQEGMNDFGKPLEEIITMASLIEGEARKTATRKQVSGILWRRFELGMPLQVDAVFPYIMGKDTFEVTFEDLKYDSPYNTYLYLGLPPGPINNPSLDSIEAAITPTATKYLYYLTDHDGEMRYASTHAQHLTNRAKYLGK